MFGWEIDELLFKTLEAMKACEDDVNERIHNEKARDSN